MEVSCLVIAIRRPVPPAMIWWQSASSPSLFLSLDLPPQTAPRRYIILEVLAFLEAALIGVGGP